VKAGEPAFGFVLEEKLLLGQSSYGFELLWLAFGFCKSKNRLKSLTKQGLNRSLISDKKYNIYL